MLRGNGPPGAIIVVTPAFTMMSYEFARGPERAQNTLGLRGAGPGVCVVAGGFLLKFQRGERSTRIQSRQDRRNRLGTDAVKLFASTAAKEVADAAVQVLGGWGYCAEFRVEQFLRDAKLIEIGGGTLEAHQKNIVRDLTRPG